MKKKCKGQPLIAECLILLDLRFVIPVCFHQRRYLLTACWGASTCRMGCLFFSSVLCVWIDCSSFLSLSVFGAFYDDFFVSLCFGAWHHPPIYISVPFFSTLFSFCSPFFLPPPRSLCYFSFTVGSVLCVLWWRSPDSLHPVSTARSPRGRLPEPPEAHHVQGL